MTYVLIAHEVENFDEWKSHFDEHESVRAEMGEQSYQLFQSSEDPNHVVIAIEFDTEENARAFTESEDLREKMVGAGVKGRPDFSFLTLTEQRDIAQPQA